MVDPVKCLGINKCGKCIEICGFNAIEEINGKALVNNKCMGCGLCISKCPSKARILTPRPSHRIKLLDWSSKIEEPTR